MNMLEVRMSGTTLHYFNDGVEITRDEYLALSSADHVDADTQPEVISYAVHTDGRIEVIGNV